MNALHTESGVVALKIGLCVLLGAAAVIYGLLSRRAAPPVAWRILGAVMTLLAIIAAGAYVWFGNFPWKHGFNAHEVFHYYLGSKYHRELGYSNLYPCALLADAETEQFFRRFKDFRDSNTLRHVPRHLAVADATEYLAPFTPQRWREFKNDVAWITSFNSSRYRLITDLGYVASPFWTAWASVITNRIPTGSIPAMAILCSLDYLFLLIMIGVVWRTGGWIPAMLTLTFFGVNYALHSWTIKGSVLRLDWFAALIIAVCMLKVGRYKTAGFFAAFATLIRIFPVVFWFALLVKFAVNLITRRPIDRNHARFFLSFFLFSAAFVVFPMLHEGGTRSWGDFYQHMSSHSDIVRIRRMGFETAVTYSGEQSSGDYQTDEGSAGREAWSAEKQEKNKAVRPYLWAVLGVVAVLVGWIGLKLEDYQTPALGVILLYFAVEVSWYYYMVLLVPFVVFVMGMERWRGVLGVIALCAFTLGAYALKIQYPFAAQQYAYASWLLFGYLAFSAVVLTSARQRIDPCNKETH